MPIETTQRRSAADLLQRFVDGKISNVELESLWPRGEDLAVEAIRDAAWGTYDDLVEHRYKPSPAADDLLHRCIDFLRTDARYDWPHPNKWLRIASIPLSLITMGLANRVLWKRYQFPEYWPFESAAAREAARRG